MTALRKPENKALPSDRNSCCGKIGWVPIAVCLLLGTGTLSAATWSDLAGHSFEAEFVELENKVVVFERPNGDELRLKLSSLAKEDRIRVRKLAGNYNPIPPKLKSYCDLLRKRLRRARLFFKHGRISAAELREQKRKLRKILVRRMKDDYSEDKINEVAFYIFGTMPKEKK